MIIHKFGGKSLGDSNCISNVVDIVLDHHARNADAGDIIVVSAMSGVTDQLIRGARAATLRNDPEYREVKAELLSRHLTVIETLLSPGLSRLEIGGFIEDQLNELERLYRSIAILGELTERGRDVVLSFGEKLSANIVSTVLRARGARSQAINATQLIVTDNRFGEAALQMDITRCRLQEYLHPKTIRPVIEHKIPLRILNSFNPQKESLPVLMFSQSFSEHSLNLIVSKQDQRHCQHILAREILNGDTHRYSIGVKERVGTVSVVGLAGENGNGIVQQAYSALGKCGTQVISVAQPASERSVSFCIPEEQIPQAVQFIYRELGLDRHDLSGI